MLTQFIIDFIHSSGDATSEYLLLQHIEKKHTVFFSTLGKNPSLFKKHFYLFHHLYKLRECMADTEQTLMISSVEIRICSKKAPTSNEMSEVDGLKDFYLDIDNLYLTDQQIAEMLTSFWEKYFAIDKKAEAILLLGLEKKEHLDMSIIRNRFNQLAHQHHPDKGGKQEYFFELKKAYNTLKCLY